LSLLIKNGTLLLPDGARRGNLLVDGGRIASITVSEPSAESKIDADGMVVMPGMIDPHVHFRQPGMHGEDWLSGSKSALAGGVTTVLDMPNTQPPTTSAQLLSEKIKLIEEQTSGGPCVNYGLHLGATNSNSEEIIKAGLGPASSKRPRLAASLKLFMGSSTGDLLIDDDNRLKELLSASLLVSVHAEDEAVIRASRGGIDHLSRRPKGAALSAIRKLLAWGAPGRVYVCHLTSGEEADLASPFYREAAPHHLFLSESLMGTLGAFAKVNPPLRSESDRAALWAALADGKIDCIGSDHAPHTAASKRRAPASSPSGVPGVETALPLMFNAFLKEGLPMQRLVALTSRNAARIFRIPRKGALATGLDADIAIIDPNEVRKVRAEGLHYKCGWTPYEGMTVVGWPKHTIIGGEVAYSEGSFSKAKGRSVVYEV